MNSQFKDYLAAAFIVICFGAFFSGAMILFAF